MKDNIKIISVLTLTCIVCAFSLAFVNSLAKEKIVTEKKNKIEDAISILSPDAKDIQAFSAGGETIYKLFNSKQVLIGYAFLAQGNGYQGVITMMVAMDAKLEKLQGIEIIESVETPGLGAKINEVSFNGQFKNLNAQVAIECVKEEAKQDNQIKAISSATISSKAVVNILNEKIKSIRSALTK